MAAHPTVLVGLGGIGTEIVNRVAGMIPEKDRPRVVVHGFDTDVQDIAQRQNMKDAMTQISSKITVGRCVELVDQMGGRVREWFPPLSTELARKPLTEGAGQIRSVARLANYHAILRGRMKGLENQIAGIFSNHAQQFETTPRIVIVSSLAGGTGAGLFLQVALYLRELLTNYFAQEAVIVRGMFLLPDILIKTNALPEKQQPMVRANAYACLKELDAITRNAGGIGDGVTIELEYRPGQENLSIQKGQKPYDYCFLYDFENAAGRNLRDLHSYKTQVTQALYLQFFTPMGDKGHSQEDNNIRDNINKQGSNCYCGAGVSRLIYPYEGIVTYCVTRWIEAALSGQWRRLDDEYEEELKVYEQDLNQGNYRERPLRKKRYVEMVDSWGNGDKPEPFFKNIHRSACTLDEKGKPFGRKMDSFLKAVEERTVSLLAGKADLQEALNSCAMDDGNLKHRDAVLREVSKMEDNLESLKETVFRVVDELKNQIISDIIGSSCYADNCLTGNEEYRLNAWFLREAIHPVAVRYMLYQLELSLDQAVKKLAAENKRNEESIQSYKYDAYDIADTEEVKETAEDRVRLAMDQGVLAKIFKNRLTDFIKFYEERSRQQKYDLEVFAAGKLKEKISETLLRAVRELNEQWEHIFAGLKDERITLKERIRFLEKEHVGHGDLSTLFVLASKEDKEKAWDGMRLQLISQTDLPADICWKIYGSVFKRFGRSFFPWAVNGNNEEELRGFEGILSEWCREKIYRQNDIRLSLISAVRRSGRAIKDAIHDIDLMAQPFVPTPPEWGEDRIAYWGIHPDNVRELTGEETQECFRGIGNLLETHAFSPYELIRYRVIYGLMSSDLPKFKGKPDSSTKGEYFSAYMKSVEELQQHPDTYVTHHLDQRWHLAAYMPDLNPEIAALDRGNIARAFLDGVALTLFNVISKDGRRIWDATMVGGGKKYPMVNGEYVEDGFLNLYRALSHNPVIVDGILKAAEKIKTADAKEHLDQVAKHRFIRLAGDEFGLKSGNVKNVLDAIFSFVTERPGENLVDESVDVLSRYFEEVVRYHVGILGEHRKITARKQAAELIEKMRSSSDIYSKAQENSGEAFSKWKGKIDACVAGEG